jgi:hypothetical protein
MQVFILSRDHEKRAEYHCDVHINKQLIEAAQILNTALHNNGARDDLVFYQPTHEHHPWVKWAADRHASWQWLHNHAVCLAAEFTDRMDANEHKTDEQMKQYWDGRTASIRHAIGDDGDRTSFPLAMDDEYVHEGDPVRSYREYYVAEKVPQDWCSWRNSVPDWVNEMM